MRKKSITIESIEEELSSLNVILGNKFTKSQRNSKKILLPLSKPGLNTFSRILWCGGTTNPKDYLGYFFMVHKSKRYPSILIFEVMAILKLITIIMIMFLTDTA